MPRRTQHQLAQKERFGRFTVFLFESPNASDLGGPDREADLLKAACDLSGHRFAGFAPVNLAELEERLRYIFKTWTAQKGRNAKPQFSLHFSAHGNDDGVQVGREFAKWNGLFDLLGRVQGKKKQPFIVSLSSCGGQDLNLTRIKHAGGARPLYVFSFASEVGWPDAALTWAIIYRKISGLRVGDTAALRRLVDAVRDLELGELRYHRWNGKKFSTYRGKGSKESAT